MTDALLILNAGSSSVKFSLFSAEQEPKALVRGQVEGLGRGQGGAGAEAPRFRAQDASGAIIGEHSWGRGAALDHAAAVEFLFSWGRSETLRAQRIIAAGHRVVHGGTSFAGPVRIDADILRGIETLTPLAPLHQPHNIAAIRAVARLLPDLPQVACFDTAFHRTQPAVAHAFAIPREHTDAGIRRYGFHGLSYEYIAGILPRLDPVAAAGRTIIAHLGNGASLCALRAGRSIATTMGFTALDGLVMGTRCGSIDAGVLLYLQRDRGLTIEQIEHLLYERSGLLGVSGISGDMRTLLTSEDPRAREAIDLFVYRAAREIGSLAAALGGLDALVFTGGIGENAAAIRLGIAKSSAWLGIELDEAANLRGGPRISTQRDDKSGRVAVWVVPTNEELMIARHTASVLTAARSM